MEQSLIKEVEAAIRNASTAIMHQVSCVEPISVTALKDISDELHAVSKLLATHIAPDTTKEQAEMIALIREKYEGLAVENEEAADEEINEAITEILDEAIHQIHDNAASSLNNQGVEAQVAFIFGDMTVEGAKAEIKALFDL